ncbi:AAA family ATPase [Variovorax sp. V15]|uniref:AAA family ATPase n=1 Tax=Variovorax sp. V15 TaxID=3065952 RepID=UPI0034E8E250
MRFLEFYFENFRGIASSHFKLSKSSKKAVHVLVGLNESGKTTILEGINHFRTNPNLRKKNAASNFKTEQDFQAMLPISKRSIFNGKITISGKVELEDDDILLIKEFLKAEFGFIESNITKEFSIESQIKFENSKREKVTNIWNIKYAGRKRKGSTPFKLLTDEDWLKATNFVETLVPSIIYFPYDLFDFPDIIQLEVFDQTKKGAPLPNRQNFYYKVFEDVLRAIDSRLRIETHILARTKSSDPSDKQNLSALLVKIESHLNNVILKEWKRIFKDSSESKKFRVFVQNDADGLWRVEIKLAEGLGLYSLNERSAGFRWFFAFTMLVRYRTHRNDRLLFLFDEPAANLHPRAQMQLLESFSELSEKYQFIYTTHSHHLVNPLWLESTYVVKNEALGELADLFDADPTETNISITPYRKFVGEHPGQYFYYKPILDALEYGPSKLSLDTRCILVEGKTDFYCLEYLNKHLFAGKFNISFFPGGGSGSLDPLISLLYGWGHNFLVLLDSDSSGKSEQRRYTEKFELIVRNRIFTLGETLSITDKVRIEEIFSDIDKENIRARFFPSESSLTKPLLHKSIQELLSRSEKIELDQASLDRFEEILSTLHKNLDGLESKPLKS